jgi:hypothetical protein
MGGSSAAMIASHVFKFVSSVFRLLSAAETVVRFSYGISDFVLGIFKWFDSVPETLILVGERLTDL